MKTRDKEDFHDFLTFHPHLRTYLASLNQQIKDVYTLFEQYQDKLAAMDAKQRKAFKTSIRKQAKLHQYAADLLGSDDALEMLEAIVTDD